MFFPVFLQISIRLSICSIYLTQTEAEYLIRQAKKSLPSSSHCKLLKEDEARYTIENAIFVRRIVESLGEVERVIVVTNEFHLRRSLLIFFTVFEEVKGCRVEGKGAEDGEHLERDTGIGLEVWLEQVRVGGGGRGPTRSEPMS